MKEQNIKWSQEYLTTAWNTRYDPSKEYVPPPAALKVRVKNPRNNSYMEYGVGGKDAIGGVVGKKKSRKTFYLGCLIASAIKRDWVADTLLELEEDEVILHFDTEQPEGDFMRADHRIFQHAEVSKEEFNKKFYSFRIREQNKQERLQTIEAFIKFLKDTGKKIGLLIIDGIVDICKDHMSNEAVQELTDWVLKLHDQNDFMLLYVLHLNKGDGNTRGFLGTEMDNKSSFQLRVHKEKDDDIFSTVSFKDGRYFPFPAFTIAQDKNGLYHSYDEDLWIIDDSSSPNGEMTEEQKIKDFADIIS